MGVTTDEILADVAKKLGYRRMREHTRLRNVWIMDNPRGETFVTSLVVAIDTKTGECHLSGNYEQSEAAKHFENLFDLIFKERTLYHMANYAGFADEVMEEFKSGRKTIAECYAFLDTLTDP